MRKYAFLFGFIFWLLVVSFSGIPESIKNLLFWMSIAFCVLYVGFHLLMKSVRKTGVSKGTFIDSKFVDGNADNQNSELK